MYSKATYVKPYIRKFIRVLGINNVGTLNKPKMNVIYAILANNNIKPIDKNKYGVPLFQYRDLDGLNDLSIIAGFRKWKDDMLRKDIEISSRSNDNVQKQMQKRKMEKDTQQKIAFIDENDDLLYESMFGRKVYFTESQIKHIKKSIENTDTEKYVENDFGEKWLKVNGSKLCRKLESKIKSIPNKSDMGLLDLAKVIGDRDPRYIAVIHGGLNGSGEWTNYFQDMCKVIKVIPNSWVIDLKVDVLDDTWSLYVGFRTNEKLNEGAWGYEPDSGDDYWDLASSLCDFLFKKIIKDLEEYTKDGYDCHIYPILAIITELIKTHAFSGEKLLYSNSDIEKRETDRLAIKLIKVCNKAFKILENDDNSAGWSDFEKYKSELKKLHNDFIKSMKKCNISRWPDLKCLNESENFIDPQRVLLVKEFLDDNFVRGNIPYVGDDGYPKTKLIVGMKGTDGNVAKNMDAEHLFYLLQDKFKGIYSDKAKRNKFLKQVMKDWYDHKITREGLLSVNKY